MDATKVFLLHMFGYSPKGILKMH